MTTKPDFAALQAEASSRHQRHLDAQMAALNARTKRLPAGCDQQGRHETRPLPDACAEEGGRHADPAPTGRTKKNGALAGLLLVAAPWVLAIVCWAVAARWGHWPN